MRTFAECPVILCAKAFPVPACVSPPSRRVLLHCVYVPPLPPPIVNIKAACRFSCLLHESADKMDAERGACFPKRCAERRAGHTPQPIAGRHRRAQSPNAWMGAGMKDTQAEGQRGTDGWRSTSPSGRSSAPERTLSGPDLRPSALPIQHGLLLQMSLISSHWSPVSSQFHNQQVEPLPACVALPALRVCPSFKFSFSLPAGRIVTSGRLRSLDKLVTSLNPG